MTSFYAMLAWVVIGDENDSKCTQFDRAGPRPSGTGWTPSRFIRVLGAVASSKIPRRANARRDVVPVGAGNNKQKERHHYVRQ